MRTRFGDFETVIEAEMHWKRNGQRWGHGMIDIDEAQERFKNWLVARGCIHG